MLNTLHAMEISNSTPSTKWLLKMICQQDLPERSESVLLVVALLPSKSPEVYNKMFRKVKETLVAEFGDIGQRKRFHFDMEVAAMNACRQVFNESRVTTCYFHFAKNIMDKVHRMGLRDYYADMRNPGFYNWLRTLIGSALLPRDLFDNRIWPYIEQNVPTRDVRK
ncbi:hypothetical protein QR680_009061 [Steinernema hermaphroditum]|uniref:MULE transposase domain-containing protein n=1 Tax=Steinernema hermaphroditum TaxID=289476 RepID=A0AA39IIX7_9BILA|nr:hypothetical protein QR680_009061 [Steinernema hermaphroditum]